MKKIVREGFLLVLGGMFELGKLVSAGVKVGADEIEKGVNYLIQEGKMAEPQAREFVSNTIRAAESKSRELETSAKKITKETAQEIYQAAAREVNRMAKKVVSVTNPPPPPKKPAAKKPSAKARPTKR